MNDQQYAEAVGVLEAIVERLFLIELGRQSRSVPRDPFRR